MFFEFAWDLQGPGPAPDFHLEPPVPVDEDDHDAARRDLFKKCLRKLLDDLPPSRLRHLEVLDEIARQGDGR